MRLGPACWLWAMAAVLGGCANLLDFDAVTFVDEDAGASGGSAGQAGGGAGGEAASGGTGGSGTGGTSAGGTGGTGTGGTGGTGGTSVGGTGGTGVAGAAGSNTGGTGGTGGTATGGTGGAPDPCAAIQCGANEYCHPTTVTCVCSPGFVSTGNGCEPSLPGDPALHTEQEVCDQWSQGHALLDPSPWTAGPAECDPGTLSRDGIDDTLVRINMFRWLVGLGPVTDSASLNEMNRWCAVLASWNPPGVVPNPHSPPSTAKCYTSEGASGTGSSNLAWGSGHPAHAIDQFIQDNGNFSTFGHRRWIFNPPLGPVGIGYYAGGGQYGNAQCLAVFGSSGGGPSPDWIAFPPPGYAPMSIMGWVWTFHHKLSGTPEMTVVRQSDAAELTMEKMPLSGGYGSYATMAFRPSGWSPAAGEIYIVTVEGVGSEPIIYELKPTSCN